MRIYGLTGGIASGKSTVANMLRELGAKVVDADALAREVVHKGTPALAAIEERFGSQVLTAEGELDRKALASLIFTDANARLDLNQIIHPRIAKAGREAMAKLAGAGEPLAIYEAALIVENNLQKTMDGLIVVSVLEHAQLERLMQREGLTLAQANSRLAAQLPLRDKLDVADHIIDNGGDQEATRAQVKALWERLR